MGRKGLAGERRTQILDALYRCISKYGLPNSSIKMIAKEAGVQPSILYHYFKDRDEIIEELMAKVIDEMKDYFAAEINTLKDPEKRFKKGIAFLFGPQLQDPSVAAFFFSCFVEGKRNPKVQRGMEKLFRTFRDVVVQLLAETGKTEGLSAAETKNLATMLIAVQDGMTLQKESDAENISMRSIHRLTEHLVRLYIDEKRKILRKKTQQ